MIIRQFNADDAFAFYCWYHDKRLSHFFRGFLTGVSLEQCKNAPQFLRGHILVGVLEGNEPYATPEDKDRLVGAVTLADRDPILRIYKLGLLVHPEFQQHGLGKDLMAAGIEWSFNTMNAHKIMLEILDQDQRVITGAEAAGFTREGLSRKSAYLDGKFCNEVIFSMLREEYH